MHSLVGSPISAAAVIETPARSSMDYFPTDVDSAIGLTVSPPSNRRQLNSSSRSQPESNRRRSPSDETIQMSYSPSSQSQAGINGNGTVYHFKILVPAVAAGAIIGKGGETIGQLQRDTGTRVKMSKSNDFYPGTNERVCLISGQIDGILKINDFIMEKIREKPDPNAKMAIDFDSKQPAEREKQVKILVPNSTAGMIIGKAGMYIKQIKEESGAYVQISQKSVDHALAERCITVIGEIEFAKRACNLILSKIVEDPQSGSCLNVSYADVQGPVANFNPTGSPYASNPNNSSGTNNGNASGGGLGGAANNSNPNYSSNGSLNSLSPATMNNFSNGGPGTSNSAAVQAVNMMTPFGNVFQSTAPSSGTSMQLEQMRAVLRACGYNENTVNELCNAYATLCNYGALGLAFALSNNLTLNPAAPPMIGANPFGPSGMAPDSTGGIQIGGVSPGHHPHHSHPNAGNNSGLFGSGAGLDGGPSHHHGNGGNLFGPVGSLGLGSFAHSTPTRGERTLNMNSTGNDSGSVFENFRSASPPLVSPGNGLSGATGPTGAGPNSASFGNLGRANSSPVDGQTGALDLGPGGSVQNAGSNGANGASKSDVEVSDHIIGAILGPGGKQLIELQRLSGASIQISKKGIFVPGTRNRIVTITGAPGAVTAARLLIDRQIDEEESKRHTQAAAQAAAAAVHVAATAHVAVQQQSQQPQQPQPMQTFLH